MKEIDPSTAGGRIRAARLAAGMSVADLAEACDISPAYLGTIERNKKTPSPELLAKLHAALGIGSADPVPGGRGAGPAAVPPANGIDARLFAAIAAHAPGCMDESLIAGALMIRPQELRAVLDGSDPSFRPWWPASFAVLAAGMDPGVPDMLEEIADYIRTAPAAYGVPVPPVADPPGKEG